MPRSELPLESTSDEVLRGNRGRYGDTVLTTHGRILGVLDRLEYDNTSAALQVFEMMPAKEKEFILGLLGELRRRHCG
jgi:hypothetical protein